MFTYMALSDASVIFTKTINFSFYQVLYFTTGYKEKDLSFFYCTISLHIKLH